MQVREDGAVSAEDAARLGGVRAYVIDMDGVLYRGDAVLPHVHDFLAALDRRAIPYVMATNNSTRTPAEYVEKLATMNLSVPAERIVTSGLATRAWLDRQYPAGTTIFAIGAPALFSVLFDDGRFRRADKEAEVVVTGADFELTFEKLRIACLAIRRGAAWVATNPDTTFPTEEGLIPGAGALLAALEAATSVKPTVIGKPEPGILVQSAELLGTAPQVTAMLGDRLDTDVLAGQRAGFTTVLVLTGVTSPADVELSPIKPDVVFPNLGPLVEYYRTAS